MNGLIELLNWALEHWFFSLLIALFILMVIEQVSNCLIRIAAIHGLTKIGDAKRINEVSNNKEDNNG